MRRRLFWTIAGVAVVTGLLVLAGSLFASQRAAVEATYREMEQSAQEAVAVLDDFLDRAQERPAVALELLRLVEDDQLGPLFARIRRTSGGSEIGFAALTADGRVRSNSPLFGRVLLDGSRLSEGLTQFTRSDRGELVVIKPTVVSVRGLETTVYVGLAREAPVVRPGDQMRGLLFLALGVAALAAILARFLSSHVANKLEPLAEASRRVASGDMKARVPDLRDPDLDELASAFNEMAAGLEDTQEREREFLLGVGHDLRTPLTTIGGYAEALEAGELTPEDLARVGSVLGVQTRQLSRLIEDLTTLARLEQPEFDMRTEDVDVGAHVAEVVEGFRRRAEEVGISLRINVEDGLVIPTDPDRLGQIAQNLVENALRHTPETGSVEVVVHREPDHVAIAVADSGSGIAERDLPHVFDRHFVGRQRSVRNEGSGLGLSIVKGLVERMGGQVDATSRPGVGTTISIRLPIGGPG